MEQPFTVKQVQAFGYTVVAGPEPKLSTPIASLIITESKEAQNRADLLETEPEFAFRIVNSDGEVIADIAAGWWPFVREVLKVTIPLHSEECARDNALEIGTLSIMVGGS